MAGGGFIRVAAICTWSAGARMAGTPGSWRPAMTAPQE
jgi:hypothetical protein